MGNTPSSINFEQEKVQLKQWIKDEIDRVWQECEDNITKAKQELGKDIGAIREVIDVALHTVHKLDTAKDDIATVSTQLAAVEVRLVDIEAKVEAKLAKRRAPQTRDAGFEEGGILRIVED